MLASLLPRFPPPRTEGAPTCGRSDRLLPMSPAAPRLALKATVMCTCSMCLPLAPRVSSRVRHPPWEAPVFRRALRLALALPTSIVCSNAVTAISPPPRAPCARNFLQLASLLCLFLIDALYPWASLLHLFFFPPTRAFPRDRGFRASMCVARRALLWRLAHAVPIPRLINIFRGSSSYSSWWLGRL